MPGALKEIPEHKQKEMMESYKAFYGVENDPKIAKITYNKLYQASRTGGAADPMSAIPKEIREDPTFKHNQKRFFQNEVSDTASQYKANANKFFNGGHEGKAVPENTIGDKFQ